MLVRAGEDLAALDRARPELGQGADDDSRIVARRREQVDRGPDERGGTEAQDGEQQAADRGSPDRDRLVSGTAHSTCASAGLSGGRSSISVAPVQL